MRITAYRTIDNGVKSYGCDSRIPMNSATDSESETCAARIIDALNMQLQISGSKYRLVFQDKQTKEIMSVKYAEIGQ